jgi:transmembrane sensor
MESQNSQLEFLNAQQASAWVKMLHEQSFEQRAAFVTWLKESPRNVREFLIVLTIDRALDQLDSKRVVDIKSLLEQVGPRIVQLARRSESMKAQSRPRPGRWVAVAVAASLLVLSVAAWIFLIRAKSEWREFETAWTEQRAFALEDGSVIELNTHSRVAIDFSSRSRDVRLLEGEALFRVRHDVSRPFRVFTDDAVVQVVGTQFDVYNRADGSVIAVVEGRVNVKPKSQGASSKSGAWLDGPWARGDTGKSDQPVGRSLGANEEAEVSRTGLVTVHTMTDVSDAVAWRQRRLIFRQQTLDHIAEEFNRYNRKRITLVGSAVMNRVYTGVFDADDPDAFAQVLAHDNDLAVEQSEQEIVVRAR